MRVGELIVLPIRVVWAVIKGCAIPAAVIALAWWLLPDSWARWITVAMVTWAIVVLLLIAAKVSGHVRGFSRGPFYISHLDDDWL